VKAVLQRVLEARVVVDGETVGAIDRGLLVLVCAEPHDTTETGRRLLTKLLKLRVFSDDSGKMNRSLQDIQGGLLLVSQFTLAADTRGGNRPSFSGAAPPEQARTLWDELVQDARATHDPVAFGVFAADMQVSLVNDGPVTLPLQID
jgi:D-tyrosyl-tRNA(Tyr) deacylase